MTELKNRRSMTELKNRRSMTELKNRRSMTELKNRRSMTELKNMGKFKKGDRVRVIEGQCSGFTAGHEGVILSEVRWDWQPYKLEDGTIWDAHELKLIEEEQPVKKFKVGDKVRVIKPDNFSVGYGWEAEIVDDDDDWIIEGDHPDGCGGKLTQFAYEDDLELIEEKENKMNNSLNYTMSPFSISVFLKGEMKSISSDEGNFEKVKEYIKAGDYSDLDELDRLLDKKKAILSVSEGNVELIGNQVLYKGAALENVFVDKIIYFAQEGLPVARWLKFLDNLMDNPSYRCRENLCQFLEKFSAPITEDGCFITFKKVREDWYDIHTGKTSYNYPGSVIQTDRRNVDEDPNKTCSAGLHVCASHYLDGFGSSGNDRVVLCKVNPADVVAIPTDYGYSKMRVCKYEVLEEVANQERRDEVDRMSVWLDQPESWGFEEEEPDDWDKDEYSDDYIPECGCIDCEDYRQRNNL